MTEKNQTVFEMENESFRNVFDVCMRGFANFWRQNYCTVASRVLRQHSKILCYTYLYGYKWITMTRWRINVWISFILPKSFRP